MWGGYHVCSEFVRTVNMTKINYVESPLTFSVCFMSKDNNALPSRAYMEIIYID